MKHPLRHRVALVCLLTGVAFASAHGQQPQNEEHPRFTGGVELIDVTATVSDGSGRFVSGLTQDDFDVYEDGVRQTITNFSAERVPVSLGIALDISGSMAGPKIRAAEGALKRFLSDLLDPSDEIFVYEFNDRPQLVQGWTTDRRLLSEALGHIKPDGGTALYDAVADSVKLAGQGRNQKKAIVIISDGNDTSSRTPLNDLRQQIRESQLLVYAVGIDGPDEPPAPRRPIQPPRMPFPFPPRGRGFPFPGFQAFPQVSFGQAGLDQGVNEGALRELTDDSGGRTEIIRRPDDLDPATARIADELSKQYYLGYVSSAKPDGRWHSIKVVTRNPDYRVRARTGYIAN
jgi:Ca-activated chloride channel homolog